MEEFFLTRVPDVRLEGAATAASLLSGSIAVVLIAASVLLPGRGGGTGVTLLVIRATLRVVVRAMSRRCQWIYVGAVELPQGRLAPPARTPFLGNAPAERRKPADASDRVAGFQGAVEGKRGAPFWERKTNL